MNADGNGCFALVLFAVDRPSVHLRRAASHGRPVDFGNRVGVGRPLPSDITYHEGGHDLLADSFCLRTRVCEDTQSGHGNMDTVCTWMCQLCFFESGGLHLPYTTDS